MGLDIMAYKDLVLDETRTVDEYDDPIGEIVLSQELLSMVERDFPGRTGGLRPGIYIHGNSYGFRAGSYGGYNHWRNLLSETFLGVSARTVWGDYDSYRDKPFAPLIHFSDCEGVIAGPVAKSFAKNFRDHEPPETWDEWDRGKYYHWKTAFEYASDNGAVLFC